jgi:hypothetical protein
MARGGTTPDLSKAILIALSTVHEATARSVHRTTSVYLWDGELTVTAVHERLELYVKQGLVTSRVGQTGQTWYKLVVAIEFC